MLTGKDLPLAYVRRLFASKINAAIMERIVSAL